MKVKHFLLLVLLGVLVLNLAAYSGESDMETNESSKDEEAVKVELSTPEEKKPNLTMGQVDEKEVVATVNKEELKGEKYNAVLRSIYRKNQAEALSQDTAEQVKKQALETLVNQALILQEAEEADIKVSASEIDTAFKLFADQFEDKKAMEQELDSKKVDIDTVKEQIAESIMYKKYQNEVAPVNEVTEKEIEDYYVKIEVEAKGSGQSPPPLNEIRKEIQELVIQEKQQKQFVTHIEKLKKEAKIEVNI